MASEVAAVGAGAGGVVHAVDADLYSRQLYVMGHAAMNRMVTSNVLLVGLDGVGVEIAKNVILMGVKSVALFDPQPTAWEDLASQFYLGEGDIGRPRAECCVEKLRALNQYVNVHLLADAAVSAAVAARFDVVVAADQALAEQLRLAALARACGARFIAAEARGVFCRIFCDFGASFRVDDVTGETPTSCMVAGVTQGSPGVVTTHEERRHELQDGDCVTFSEVQGMTQLNGSAPRPVRVAGPFSFAIEDTRGYGACVPSTGWVHQVKVPQDVAFKPMADMVGPVGAAGGPAWDELVHTDFAKAELAPAVHAGWAALHDFMAARGGRPPAPGDEAGVAAVVAAAQARLDGGELPAAARAAVTHLARTAAGRLGPLAAAAGGIAGQEVIKAVSGKFMPLRQWLYLDAAEALPHEAHAPPPAAETAPAGCRYDGQIAVFGRSFQAALGRQRYFLVGAGAIGCEMLKNFACMGVGVRAGGGAVTVTDMDRIEKSNLSRQFLFRPADIGAAKSVTAVAAARAMNPDLAAAAAEARVGADSEGVFNDVFWDGLTGVCTALDNVDARLYVDGRCVYYGKPLLESGTLGTKGNTQVVVPRLTENYGATRDPPEKEIPVCTLKNFPFRIEHTLQWARDWFEGELKQLPESVNAYVSSPGFLEVLARQANTRLDTLEQIGAALGPDRPSSVEDCVRWARLKFEALFVSPVKQLLFNFPPDSKTADGEPFWSGAKRRPAPLAFDAADPTTVSFLLAATQLRAAMYSLKLGPRHDAAFVQATAAAVAVRAFEPQAGVKIAANEKELEEQRKAAADAVAGGAGGAGGGGWDVEEQARALEARLPPPASLAGFALVPAEFEKDDALHVALVTACSNLRARCYRIDEADAHVSKGIVGKIIPAIATTTGLVAGLVSLELYKLVAERPLAAFKSGFANLALPLFTMSEPVACKRSVLRLPAGATYSPPPVPGSGAETAAVSAPAGAPGAAPGDREWHWSLWDRIDLEGPLTLAQFLAFFGGKMGVDVQMVTQGAAILFGAHLPPARKRERMGQSMAALAEGIFKRAFPPHQRFITFEVLATRGGEDVNLPYVRYRLGGAELRGDAAGGGGAGGAAGPC